ncbi:MAG: flagellar hook-basal body complex protein FliE [bacterium]
MTIPINSININSIKELNPNDIANPAASSSASNENGAGSFSNTLSGYIDKVNNMQTDANKQAELIASGKSSNIHQAMIDVEKANDSFELMMQMRNKIITAYNTVINMQV